MPPPQTNVTEKWPDLSKTQLMYRRPSKSYATHAGLERWKTEFELRGN
jgi:hypothetical protein